MSKSDGTKEIEEFPRKLRIFFWVIVFLFVFGTAGFRVISENTWGDAFLRTAQTLAFIFDNGSSPSERSMEIFLAIVGVFLIWWVLWSLADLVLEGSFKKYLKRRYYSSKVYKMKDHVIIIGGGRIGEEISRVLSSRKKPFVIIESDQKIVASLKKKGYIIVEGDALNEEILKKANIEKASKIIISLPKTEINILLTLAAKELNPNIEVHSRCENTSLVSKLKRAGARVVTIPEIVAADKIAEDLGI